MRCCPSRSRLAACDLLIILCGDVRQKYEKLDGDKTPNDVRNVPIYNACGILGLFLLSVFLFVSACVGGVGECFSHMRVCHAVIPSESNTEHQMN